MKQELSQYLSYLKYERNLQPISIYSHEKELGRFFDFLKERNVEIENVDHILIRDFLRTLCEKKQKKSTRYKTVNVIKSFFLFCYRKALIKTNPAKVTQYPKRDRPLPSFLTEKEVERFLPLPILAYRDYAILELLYATGARLSEIIYINIDDVNLSDRTILIRRRERKKRMVFFGRKAARILKFYLDVRPVLVKEGSKERSLFLNCYGRRISGRAVHTIVEKYWFLSGIPRKITPQSFRHSFAAHLLDRGGDSHFVQELLGHSHIETTERYSSIKIGYLKTAHDKYLPRFFEQKGRNIQPREDITGSFSLTSLIRY